MAAILTFRSPARFAEEASGWLARADRGLTDGERAGLGDWLRADARNRDAFVELAELWDELDVLGELADVAPLERHPLRANRRRRHALAAAAAAAAVACAVAAWAALGFVLEADEAVRRGGHAPGGLTAEPTR